jgi:hypothetical protein
MSLIGYVKKRTSSEIDHSPWGIQYLMGNYPHDLLLDHMGKSGVKWTRLTVRWAAVEQTKGQYEWESVDKIVDGLTSRGVDIFLGTGCSSHPEYQDFPAGYFYPPTDSPEALAGYCRYAAAMVERYRDRVRHYEIWNEPNISIFWRPKPDAKAYSLLVRRASEAMRSVDGGIKVMGGVLAGVGPHVTQYAQDFLSQPGTAEAIDILVYHPYNPVPEATLDQIVALRKAARELNPELSIWQGECGCPSSGDTIHFRGDAPWGYNVQSKWLLRRLLIDYMAGAEVSIYFLAVEFHGNLSAGSPELRMGYNTKGLIQHTTWATKPAYYVLQNLAAVVDSSWKPTDEKVEIEIVDPGIFYGIGAHEDRFPCVPWQMAMRRESVPMLAYWLPWRPQEIIKPATVQIGWSDASWDEPVCVDLLNGEVSEATVKHGTLEVPMADYPMILTEASVLELADDPQQPSYDEIAQKLRWTYTRS